ncbi:MAG TPA: hypothetical protein VFR78_06660, partial [Pyrinomonadaceae bacterium]|nr:hypothetical protein [Pyrinomonadaceae bacterium]
SVACANAVMLLARIPTTANRNILYLLMFPPSITLTTFDGNVRTKLDDIISPASGIHRPSYNGAPAKQA